MGFKKWLGGDKPVTQYEFNLIHIGYVVMLAIFIFVYTFTQIKNRRELKLSYKLDREQVEKLHQNKIRRDDETAKINREIREDQHKFNIRIQKEINTLKKNCKADKK